LNLRKKFCILQTGTDFSHTHFLMRSWDIPAFYHKKTLHKYFN